MTLSTEARLVEKAPPLARVRRFEPIERLAHWWVAGCFAMTLLSGAALGDREGRAMSAALTWHIVSASALVAGLVCLPLFPGRRALWASVRSLMGARGGDRDVPAPGSPLSGERTPAPPAGRKFNLAQQAAAYVFAALMVAIYATGIAALSGGGGDGGRGPHGAAVALMVIALAGHVFLAVVYPSTRPALRGMLTGWVDRTWAQRHHPEWVAELDASKSE